MIKIFDLKNNLICFVPSIIPTKTYLTFFSANNNKISKIV